MHDPTFDHPLIKTLINQKIAALALGQGGLVQRVQLLDLGLSSADIGRRIRRGGLIRVHRGVYAVGHLPTDDVSRCKGALLAAGPRSAVAFNSAGAYWGIRKYWPKTPQVWVATSHNPPTVETHHTDTLTATEVFQPEPNFRITSPARTLMDLAPTVKTDKQLTWMVSNAIVNGKVRLEQIATVLQRHPSDAGAKRLTQLLALFPDEPFRSPWEIDWPPFAAKYDIEGYEMNVLINGTRVDITYDRRLVIWMDGWQTHQLKPTFEQDRAEANTLLAELGILNLRITYDQFHQTPDRVADWVCRTLARVRAQPGNAG